MDITTEDVALALGEQALTIIKLSKRVRQLEELNKQLEDKLPKEKDVNKEG